MGQGAALIRSRKAPQIDLSKTMTRLLRNINPHTSNIGWLRQWPDTNVALQPFTEAR